jgi:hypothetical protein
MDSEEKKWEKMDSEEKKWSQKSKNGENGFRRYS